MTGDGKRNGSGRNGARDEPSLTDAPTAAIADATRGPMQAAQATMRPPLPRRFYQEVTVGAASGGEPGHAVLLDGRPVRTPRKVVLLLPTRPLAEAVSAEWSAQVTAIDPAAMPMTRFANTALDGVKGREAEVAADVVKYAGSDLLCYRADAPAGLVARQAALWDPVLHWAGDIAGARFEVQRGIVHVAQPAAALAGLARRLAHLDAFALTALHTITTLTGSALLALAVHERHVTGEAAWQAAHVDEDWQIAQWGEDAEATERRRRRKLEMDAAARLLDLM